MRLIVFIMKKLEKIEEKIKDLNAFRAVYHREFEIIEKKYFEGEISEEEFEKHKAGYEKKRGQIRGKIHILEEKLERLKKANPD